MMDKIKGKVIILGSDVDTDQILPGYAMSEPYEEIGKFAMAGEPTGVYKENYEPGCILVAARNFGCGSSREQAPISLKQAKVSLVIAQGFARIFRRNCINIGLPVFVADAVNQLKTGDIIEVDLDNGTIDGPNGRIESAPLSENVLKTLQAGGLIPRVRAELGITE